MRLHYHGEVSVVCLGHVLLVLAQLDSDNVAQMRIGRVSLQDEGLQEYTITLNKTNLDPAMKPKISAFSGLVTLLAVLNISWASSIWSLVRDRFLLWPG